MSAVVKDIWFPDEVHVLGAGGHGQDIAADLRARGMTVTLFDDSLFGYPTSKAAAFGCRQVLVGINDPVLRFTVWDQLNVQSAGWDGEWAHRSAAVGVDVRTGSHTHVNAGCTLTRCKLGDFVTVSPGVDICGDVTIGDRVLIGAGATICNFVTIGSDVTVGAGAVVLPHTTISDGETWVGVPAEKTR